jgi:hypothetical protein
LEMFGMSQNRVKMLIGILAISNARPTTDLVKIYCSAIYNLKT